MSLTRRGFARTIGLGTAGVLSSSFIIGRGQEAAAFEAEEADGRDDDGIIRISSNENARGPGPKAMAALHQAITARTGRGYPPDYTNELVATIAKKYSVEETSVVVSTGSGALLAGAARAFCSATKPLVTASPTYATSDRMARRIGAPVKAIPVDGSLALDVDAMADAAAGCTVPVGLFGLQKNTMPAPVAAAAIASMSRPSEPSTGIALIGTPSRLAVPSGVP